MHALKTAAAMEQFLHTTPDPELRGLLDVCASQFHKVREFAIGHPEALEIFQAID